MHVHFEMWACLIGVYSLTVVIGDNSETENNKESNSVYTVYNREQCSKLCDYYSSCGGFTYHVGRQSSECKLLSKKTMDETPPEEISSSTKNLYSRNTYQKKRPSPSPCDHGDCRETSFCFPVLGTRSYSCLPREVNCGLYEPPTTMERIIGSIRQIWSYSATVSVRCKPDLYRNSDVSVNSRCGSDSTWSRPNLVCEEKHCSPDNLPVEMELPDSRNYGIRERGEVRCRYGWYRTSGSEGLSCLSDETWNIDLKCERVRCPVDLIGNDMKITAMTGDEPVFEVEATIACARGYNKINGTGLSSCQGNGTWSEFDLQCQIVDCGPPPLLDNTGFQNPVTRTVYQSEVLYKCIDVYRKYGGEDNITCDETGSWTLPTLDCRLVCLGNPRTQENAKIASHIPTNSFKGQTLNYSCNEDLNYFYQSGPISSVCEENMLGSLEWIMADMICVYKCSRPPETFPGTKYTLQSVEGQVFDLGYEVIYSCSIIFLSSVTTAQCKTSGWQLGNGVDLLCVVA